MLKSDTGLRCMPGKDSCSSSLGFARQGLGPLDDGTYEEFRVLLVHGVPHLRKGHAREGLAGFCHQFLNLINLLNRTRSHQVTGLLVYHGEMMGEEHRAFDS